MPQIKGKKAFDAKNVVEKTPSKKKNASKPAEPTRVETESSHVESDASFSMSFSVFVCWVLPVLCLSLFARYGVDTTAVAHTSRPPRSVPLTPPTIPQQTPKPKKKSRPMVNQDTTPLYPKMPESYNKILKSIRNRRRDFGTPKTTTKSPPIKGSASTKQSIDQPRTTTTTTPNMDAPRGASSDPVRLQHLQKIKEFQDQHEQHPDDLIQAIQYADALRHYDVQYHDGGTMQSQAIDMYHTVLKMAHAKRQALLEQGEPTNVALSPNVQSVADEVVLEYSRKSADGLVCALHTALGKVYFMANMFEKAVEQYTHCLELEPLYLDALGSRGSSLIILGQYESAGTDFYKAIEHDERRFFTESFTGLAKVLTAQEDAVPQGWEPMVEVLEELIPKLEQTLETLDGNEGVNKSRRMHILGNLNRLHHVLFAYHDVKTKDRQQAWYHLSESYKHKMASLTPWHSGLEDQKIAATQAIFHSGFWMDGIGSDTRVPIFIVGFVRSGSTLLERVLDAHPQIVGTGENSVFNGRLDDIRNQIVQVSLSGINMDLFETVQTLADGVVEEMRSKWEILNENTEHRDGSVPPERFVDKMLTNYYNIGFIHLLFPNALILHVVREPMDTLFSAYKHEFPPGTLDYTSNFASLAELYHSYRTLIEHWDNVLPGRVTHVLYEDMVHDMEGVARAIIQATGLEWDDGVLEFHKKKHAVNTLSTTQVRKGVYKDGLKSWMKYEEQLRPLVELIGDRVKFDVKTSLPGYSRPIPVDHSPPVEISESTQEAAASVADDPEQVVHQVEQEEPHRETHTEL